MQYLTIIRTLGQLLIFLAIAMLLCLPFSFYFGEGDELGITLSAGLTALCGGLMIWAGKRSNDIKIKDVFVIVTAAWMLFALFGSFVFIFTGAIPNFTNAFFETMSGFTTTGATILEDIESIPKGVLFFRAFTQWIGGGGIIVLTIALLPFLGIGGMQLFQAEVSGPLSDKIKPRITETAKVLWKIYLLYTVLCAASLYFAGMSFYEALLHSFTALPTGGYSSRNASIAAFNSPLIEWILTVFMLIASINFSLHYHLLHGRFREVMRNQEFKLYISILIIAIVIIFIDTLAFYGGDYFKTLTASSFQVLSIASTTGYASDNYAQWNFGSQYILYLMMIIGGSAGSTAGGVKIIRFYLLYKILYSELIRIMHPQAVVPIKYSGRIIDSKVTGTVALYFAVFVLLHLFGGLVVSLDNIEFTTAVTAVLACLNNIGPGLAAVGPIENFNFFSDHIKWMLSIFMLIGRLEIFTVLILLTPYFFRR
jgi:trk system potassium uptake protein